MPTSKTRYTWLLCLLSLLASCATKPPEAVKREDVQALPSSIFPERSAAPLAYESTTDLIQAIGTKIRRNLTLPPGRFPASTKVTVKLTVSSEGQIQDLKVIRSSGYRAIDRSVRAAVMKSEPLPVLASLREAKKSLAMKIVFLPFSK